MAEEKFKEAGSSTTTPVDKTGRRELSVRLPKVVLGIHSNVDENAGYIAGHAWLSVSRDGKKALYGLWPDDHPMIIANDWDDPNASDIRIDAEKGQAAVASRYTRLTPRQVLVLEGKLKENITWSYTNTCASWASETYSDVTGEYIDANDLGGFETPRELAGSISALEREDSTSVDSPHVANPAQQQSSGG